MQPSLIALFILNLVAYLAGKVRGLQQVEGQGESFSILAALFLPWTVVGGLIDLQLYRNNFYL